jgi:tripartite-type tricarboxylate transporter receptor subunit TctC
MSRFARKYVFSCLSIVLCSLNAQAQSPEEFYKGKSLDLYIGYTAGGGYDLYGRLLARHLRRHIPGNPTVVPRNMEGAGSLRLANWLYNVAPKDGTAIGTIGRGLPFDSLLARPGIQFDGSKFSWIGSVTKEVSVCVTWHTTGVKTIEEAMKKEVLVGAVGGGVGADDDEFPRIINGVLGTKMRVINGYRGGNEVVLAMERGEVNGRCGWSWSSVNATRPEWTRDGRIHLIAQLGLAKHSQLPNVPSIMEFVKTDDQRHIFALIFARQSLARPFIAPPALPPERLNALREAFMATMRDPEFLSEAAKSKMEVDPLSGVELQRLVQQIHDETSPAVAKKAASMLQ